MIRRSWWVAGGAGAFAVLALVTVQAQTVRVDLSKETAGKTPATFEPMMGTWVIAEDGGEKVVKVDGAAYRATLDPAARNLIDTARKFYGTSNEELMDNAKQFAVFPVAVLRGVESFSNGSLSLKFKTVAGNSDRASGILFNVKPNGDWLSVRYNDTEHNIALWEFHNGVRRRIVGGRGQVLADPADREKWHELTLTVTEGKNLKTTLDGATVLEYVLGTEPGPGRNGAPPNPDLFPANNPVLRPPVAGKVGLWSKSDSTSYFKDYIVTHQK
jgi:hypothetical protein